LRITDDHGQELDARFSVETTTIGADVIVESRGGSDGGPTRARNSQYEPAVEILLGRLGAAGAVLFDVLLDSRVVRSLSVADRRLLPASELPFALGAVSDLPSLRKRIGRASAAFGRPIGTTGGNPTKRIRLVVEWPGAVGRLSAELEAELAGVGAAAPVVAAGGDWREAELRACVQAYHVLWVAQGQGRAVNKAALRRATIARALPTRSEGSYEFRMQNISAVLDDLGMGVVDGYLPRRNVGRQKPVLIRLINEVWRREGRAEAATDDPEKLATRVEAAQAKLQRDSTGALPPPPAGSPPPPRLPASSTRFPRDPNVIAWVLEAAGGRCEVCGEPAPFVRANGEPYLEVHHVQELAMGGPDTTDNAVAGCPNCHRRLHHGADREAVRRGLLARVARLRDHPRTVS